MYKTVIMLLACLGLTGCSLFGQNLQSSADSESVSTYVPLDPFPVVSTQGESCKSPDSAEVLGVGRNSLPEGHLADVDTPIYKDMLSSLPDNAVRMVVENVTSSGSVTYGVGKIGGRFERYRVTADYTSADTINMPLWISKEVELKTINPKVSLASTTLKRVVPLSEVIPVGFQVRLDGTGYVYTSERYSVRRAVPGESPPSGYEVYNIPVYVGIGIRITSNIEITGSTANISGIAAIGFEAESNNLKGSLVVQTLGVNGKAVSSALPMQSELNATTAQNALIATASIKTLLYSDDTQIYPRVVGLYLPFSSKKALVNAIISELSSSRVEWKRPCYWVNSKKLSIPKNT
ncbi:hypothetical protein PS900_03668 [Pseudomonas fluorescens]|uniref:Lipoprotein n=1 Tax=Pseudomonas fluorescens TaxID=294 RepID=A0A8H2NTN2_PSEFL|nr:hypothetical protein [Pseudomonas fluorescens]VVP17359.1 hypothetical protein PS900_03668 [Pseudomonas fluorescens]